MGHTGSPLHYQCPMKILGFRVLALGLWPEETKAIIPGAPGPTDHSPIDYRASAQR